MPTRASRMLSSKGIRLFALSVAFVFVLTALSPIASATGDQPAYMGLQASPQLNGLNYNVVEMDRAGIASDLTSVNNITLPLGALNVSFRPVEMNILAPDFKALGPDGKEDPASEAAFRSVHIYYGADIRNASQVAMTVGPNWLRFFVDTPSTQYYVQPYDAQGVSNYFAVVPLPTGATSPTPNPVTLPMMTSGDMASSNITNDSSPLAIGSAAAPMASPSSPEENESWLNTYLAADDSYCNYMGSNWQNQMMTVLGNVDLMYMSQVHLYPCLTTAQHISIGSSSDAYTLWNNFKTYVVNNIQCDLAHLFTTNIVYTNGNNVGGYAVEGGAAEYQYTNNAQYKGYQCSISTQGVWGTPSDQFRFGHFMGKSLNGDEGYWCSANTWMYPAYYSTGMSFDATNAARISSMGNAIASYTREVIPSNTVTQDGMQCSLTTLKGDSVFQVGHIYTVWYSVYNTQSTPITVGNFYMAAKDASGNSMDFGYTGSKTISGYGSYGFTCSFTPSSSGSWTLCPAYQLGTNWKWFNGMAIHPTFYYALSSNTLTSTTSTTPNGLGTATKLGSFGIYSTLQTATVGSTVTAVFSLFNAASGSSTTSFSVWVGTFGSGGKDFGSVSNIPLSKKGNGFIGGGYQVVASRTIDVSGNWQFWPGYNVGGEFGPWGWSQVQLQYAFTQGSLYGYVVDSSTNLCISGATVTCTGVPGIYITGTNGFFSFNAPSGTHTLTAIQSDHTMTTLLTTSPSRCFIFMAQVPGYFGPHLPSSVYARTDSTPSIIPGSIGGEVLADSASVSLSTGICHGYVYAYINGAGEAIATEKIGFMNYAFISTGDQFRVASKWAFAIGAAAWVNGMGGSSDTIAIDSIAIKWQVIDHSDNDRPVGWGNVSTGMVFPLDYSLTQIEHFLSNQNCTFTSDAMAVRAGDSLELDCWLEIGSDALVIPHPDPGRAGAQIDISGGESATMLYMDINWV